MLKRNIRNIGWMAIGVLITCYETSPQSIGITTVFVILYIMREYDVDNLKDHINWSKSDVRENEKQIDFLHGRIEELEKERDQFQEHTYQLQDHIADNAPEFWRLQAIERSYQAIIHRPCPN